MAPGMTPPQHTPGPWRLWLSVEDRGAFILNGDSPEPYGADLVITKRDIGTPNGDEGVANARLIAAAPELLDVCRLLIRFCSARDGSLNPYADWIQCFVEDGSTITEVVEKAQAALAKAEAHGDVVVVEGQ